MFKKKELPQKNLSKSVVPEVKEVLDEISTEKLIEKRAEITAVILELVQELADKVEADTITRSVKHYNEYWDFERKRINEYDFYMNVALMVITGAFVAWNGFWFTVPFTVLGVAASHYGPEIKALFRKVFPKK